jgi:hypothetical protein
MGAPITDFAVSDERLAVLAPCMGAEGDADDEAEWPENLLSRRTRVYESGRIVRAGDDVRHAVDPDELALCRRLASEAEGIVRGVDVGMGSESSSRFQAFFVAADVGVVPPSRIDEALVRRAFGGAIFPPATLTVEPLEETGTWWSEVLQDGEGQPDSYFAPRRALVAWFRRQEAFADAAFVRIGEYGALPMAPSRSGACCRDSPSASRGPAASRESSAPSSRRDVASRARCGSAPCTRPRPPRPLPSSTSS